MKRATYRLAIVLLLVSVASAAAAAEPPSVLRITPDGLDVPVGDQIVLRFDREMVPFGRMARDAAEVPITVTPDLECDWRWLDPTTLSCRPGGGRSLAPATGYTIEVAAELAARDGSTLDAPVTHSFVTERPRVLHYWLRTWLGPGTPRVQVTFNQSVDPESVATSLVFRAGDEAPVASKVEEAGEGWDATWWVSPSRELPADRQATLEVRPGIRSLDGPEPGVEDRTVVSFHTFPAFRFLGIRCRNLNGESVRRLVDGAGAMARSCDPLAGVDLLFSSPVPKEMLAKHLEVEPDLAGGRDDYDPWEGVPSYSQLGGVREVHEYPVRLPATLRAYADYRLAASADDLEDEFGRPLVVPIDLAFRTDHRRPRLAFTHQTSVLEQQVETHLPVVVTNLDAIGVRFNRWIDGRLETDRELAVEIPRVEDLAFRFPLEVRSWLAERAGAVAGDLLTEPDTGSPRWFFSQVTPFHVHAKVGHYNTVVWVTEMATGRPVEGARVRITERVYESLAAVDGPRDEGVTDERGLVVLAGSESLDPNGELISYWRERRESHLFVEVDKGEAAALLPLAGDFRVHSKGPGSSWLAVDHRERHGHVKAWGVTPQGIYRAGDEIDYKVWVRNEGERRLAPAPAATYRLRVLDPTGQVVVEREAIELDRFGAFDGRFRVPRTGAVGWYDFELGADFLEPRVLAPLRVLVSDFTPAPFRVTSDLDAKLLEDGESLTVTTRAALHAGGPYATAAARVTAILRSTTFEAQDPLARNFWFDTGDQEDETLHRSEAALDREGILETSFEVHAENVVYGRLMVESAVRDDRGKYVTGRATVPYAGRDRFVGVRQPDWVLTAGRAARFEALVADAEGRAVAGTEVRFTVERRRTRASRVKGAGNAYLTHYTHEWEGVATCEGESTPEPVSCEFTPGEAGLYRLRAEIEDTAGRPAVSWIERWAVGKGQVLWEERPGHHMDILPESEDLAVGDQARFLVKNPFPGARALVTVERFGVLDSWIETLDESTAIVEFPVKPDYLPGFYLSLVVMSPRVEVPPGDGEVDLGKPAFRLGSVEVPVRDRYNELVVEVTPEQEVYRPGERVAVEIDSRSRQGERPETELAVAVLDESVLDLLTGGTELFDPYLGFHALDGLDLWNYNLLTRLIGIQKFEKKGADAGGGGGADPRLRSRFRFVAYWNPAVRLDADGRARIEFEVPDNLTGWRVLAIAMTPEARMGLGQGSFRVNRPTEIRPALPNQVVEGDRFEARFTVMNRTEEVRTLETRAVAEGPIDGATERQETLAAPPFERLAVGLPVTTTAPGEVTFRVEAGDATDRDAVEVRVPVGRGAVLETVAIHGSTAGDEVVQSLHFPASVRTDVGGLAVVTSPTVTGGLEGAFAYLRDYPFGCWEQILSQGVMAALYRELRESLPASLEWPAAESLPGEALERAADFQAPGGGMTFFRPLDPYASPYLSAYTALAFRWLVELGYAPPAGVEERLHAYLLNLLRKDVFPDFYSRGMASSVRAVTLAALAGSGQLAPDDFDRYRPHLQQMDLFGRAHFLEAVELEGGPPELRREILDSILAHADETAGKVTFTEVLDDGYARILSSQLRTQCSILDAIVALETDDLAAAGVELLPPKVVRGVMAARRQRDRWKNTQENMFCAKAVLDFSRRWEATAPELDVEIALGAERLGEASFRSRRDPPVTVERPIVPADPGRQGELRLTPTGNGRLYYTARLTTAPTEPPVEPVDAGIEVRREISVQRDGTWIRLDEPARLDRGELTRIDLYVTLPAARNFVVVEDPIPGGLEPVDRELATASQVDADEALEELPPDAYYRRHDDWHFFGVSRWSFYHRELRHAAARFYAEYLPAGRYHLSYTAQAIAAGDFAALPTRAEEMYEPEIFGRGAAGRLLVEGGDE